MKNPQARAFRSAYWPGGTPGRIDVELSLDTVVQLTVDPA
jgi:hypothetical protein